MNSKSIVCAIAAFSMAASSVAFAQNDKDVRADRAARGSYDVRLPNGAHNDRGPGPDRRGPGYDNRGPGPDR